MRVVNGKTISKTVIQENGVPQGTILAVILFLITINGITELFNGDNTIKILLFADDIVIYGSSNNVTQLYNQIQQKINLMQNWAIQNGFEFSIEKTKSMHICRKRRCIKKTLHIEQTNIEDVNSHKFLWEQIVR